ncbi:hypothetical protein DBT_1168 [Dissulfuribacter thermophilus]|uniref:Uncharacterized protein n=1 Tax=Dissulfuribacter thermophilus TaxID=1156395 RepID=A0A1B9F6M4_9BACT|nr:hypothetical protein DBT_1168 [Dissulfuribacter thermophilus]
MSFLARIELALKVAINMFIGVLLFIKNVFFHKKALRKKFLLR